MKKWEYCAIRIDLGSGPDSDVRDIADVHIAMASLGKQGWEVEYE